MNYSWTNVREKNNPMALIYSCLVPEGAMPCCTLSDFQGEWSTLQYVNFPLGLTAHTALFKKELYSSTL